MVIVIKRQKKLLTYFQTTKLKNKNWPEKRWEKKMSEVTINWSPSDMLEVTIKQPDDFLKVRETLTRIGVASRKDKTLFQSCHILHKQGKYYITHFKELFALDGKNSTLTENDIQRRNTIALLLQDWNLIDVVNTAYGREQSTIESNQSFTI